MPSFGELLAAAPRGPQIVWGTNQSLDDTLLDVYTHADGGETTETPSLTPGYVPTGASSMMIRPGGGSVGVQMATWLGVGGFQFP